MNKVIGEEMKNIIDIYIKSLEEQNVFLLLECVC